ncbi:hypothetical protein Q2100_19660 [Mycolicibacterium sp. KC 300]|uniref:Uncharacterized protein n=1 Tax=Mycolicibacterium arseniciresistens TaxID=3062257 RepID=A0ABT8UNK3_9MYCO|nr:hypothetical protein [Mycolicibacterium arseniciresistens]
MSFASQCCMPLMPGYLSYLASVAGQDTSSDAAVRRRGVLAHRWRRAVVGLSISGRRAG